MTGFLTSAVAMRKLLSIVAETARGVTLVSRGNATFDLGLSPAGRVPDRRCDCADVEHILASLFDVRVAGGDRRAAAAGADVLHRAVRGRFGIEGRILR